MIPVAFRRATPDAKAICFVSCETEGRTCIHLLAAGAEAILSYPAQAASEALPLPAHAYNPQRRQYHAGVVLRHLAEHRPEHLRVVGITGYDIFLPIFTHVYGEAQMPGRAAVVSAFRLNAGTETDPNRDGLHARILKIAVHEILHTFDLTHCTLAECLMQPVTSVKQLDTVPLKLCRSCRNAWDDIAARLAAGLDPAAPNTE